MRLLLLFLVCALSVVSAQVMAPGVKLETPFGVAFDQAGNWYICEYDGNRVRKVDAQGTVSVVASSLHHPHAIAISPDRQMYIADTDDQRVRRVDLNSGELTVFAGSGTAGLSGDRGPALQAQFNQPISVTLDPAATKLFVSDIGNRSVRVIDLRTGLIKTVAGNGMKGVPMDYTAASISALFDPRAAAADAAGNLYVLEREGNALRFIDAKDRIRTLPVTGLNGPKHVCLDRDGNPVIADAESHVIRKFIVKENRTVVVAGTGEKGSKFVAGDPLKTQLNRPHGVAVHADGSLWVVDSFNNRILKFSRW